MAKVDPPNTYRAGVDENGHFGLFGGRYVAETLMPLILALEAAYDAAKADPTFQADVPYTIALVELEEGPRVYGRLFPASLVPTARAPLVAVFCEVEGRTLLGFQVAT